MGGILSKKNPKGFTPYFLLLPMLIVVFSLFVYPVFYGLYISFFDITGYYNRGFVGLDNYIKVISSPSFLNSLSVTAIYISFALTVEFLFGLCLAILLNKITIGSGLIKTLMIMPMVIAPVIVGLIFRLMYDYTYGVINMLLPVVGLGKQNWLVQPQTAIFAIAGVDIWEWTPFVTLILLAGIKSIPLDLYEASSIDGASTFSQFRYITLPLLKSSALVAVIFNFMRLIRTFDVVVMLTKGGPGESTNLISYYIQQVTIPHMRLSQGAAMTQLLLLLVGLISNVYIIYIRKSFG
jgi:multiple sugar transport system permease protein